MENLRILLIEPFYSGSHKQLIDLLHKEVPGTELITLPGKKWHWKARTSALWFSQAIPREHNYRTLFTSSVLNLAELTALRPDMAALHKVIYFHENQLVYPVRKQQDRDFQFGYNQILSSIVADVVLFNSKYNMDSFLDNINSHLKLIPDHRPQGIAEQIRSKCHVLHYPIIFPALADKSQGNNAINNQRFDDCSENVMEICEGNSDMNVDMNKAKKDPLQKTDNRSDAECKEIIPKVLTGSLPCDTEDSDTSHLTAKSDTGENNNDAGESKNDTEEMLEMRCCYAKVENCNTKGRIDTDVFEELPAKKSRIMEQTRPLHILWPHRWEHDKDPETFFKVLTRLHNDGLDFRISVLGEMYSEVPEVFEKSKGVLTDKILHWGYLPSKLHYYEVLKLADCVVSTANHEFFGVAMLEAVHLGCFPLCPNKLVYPEIFPKECLYNTEQQLYKRLREFCKKPCILRSKPVSINTSKFSWDVLKDQFLKYLCL